jgi:hypothetical protein
MVAAVTLKAGLVDAIDYNSAGLPVQGGTVTAPAVQSRFGGRAHKHQHSLKLVHSDLR